MSQQLQLLEKKLSNAVRTLHGNDVQLKGGLDSAEFNLRTHQKVLNALVVDVASLVDLINRLVIKDNQTEQTMTSKMADVTLREATEESDVVVVRRVDWAHYHKEVEEELKQLAQEEKAAQEAAKKQQEAKEEEAPLPDKHPELPEGAAVFGG